MSPPPKSYVTSYNLEYPIHTFLVELAIYILHRHRRGTVDLPRRDTYSRKNLPNYLAKPWQPATIWAPGNGETRKHGICLSKVPWHSSLSYTRLTQNYLKNVNSSRMPALGQIVPFNLNYDHEMPLTSRQTVALPALRSFTELPTYRPSWMLRSERVRTQRGLQITKTNPDMELACLLSFDRFYQGPRIDDSCREPKPRNIWKAASRRNKSVTWKENIKWLYIPHSPTPITWFRLASPRSCTFQGLWHMTSWNKYMIEVAIRASLANSSRTHP